MFLAALFSQIIHSRAITHIRQSENVNTYLMASGDELKDKQHVIRRTSKKPFVHISVALSFSRSVVLSSGRKAVIFAMENNYSCKCRISSVHELYKRANHSQDTTELQREKRRNTVPSDYMNLKGLAFPCRLAILKAIKISKPFQPKRVEPKIKKTNEELHISTVLTHLSA